jgi:hypothetical protein
MYIAKSPKKKIKEDKLFRPKKEEKIINAFMIIRPVN